ncbi:FAD binding domain-containing protein [Cladophialophora immunda]|nr:FAD binding domain-containing protein [Cladophialophora immunda]
MGKHHFDVVVVGGGNTACCAALSAYEAGANVAMLEAAPKDKRGGNSRFAGTAWRFPHDGKEHLRPLLCADSLGDMDRCTMGPYTNEEFTRDMLKKSGGRHDRDEIRSIIEHGYDTVKWMADHGVPFVIPLNFWVTREGLTDEKVELSPGVPVVNRGFGRGLTDAMWQAVERTPIKVFYDSSGHDLISAGDQVLGIRARQVDGFVDFYGKVILACGGFEANPRMRRQYLGEGLELSVVRGTSFNTGVMLERAVEAGAQAQGHWGGYHCAPLDVNTPAVGDFNVLDAWERYSFPYSVMVNSAGERFVDEGEDEPSLAYSKMGAAIVKQPGGKAFQIFDQKVIHLLEPRYKSHATPICADSIEELADKLGLDRAALLNTIHEFNAAVLARGPGRLSIPSEKTALQQQLGCRR